MYFSAYARNSLDGSTARGVGKAKETKGDGGTTDEPNGAHGGARVLVNVVEELGEGEGTVTSKGEGLAGSGKDERGGHRKLRNADEGPESNSALGSKAEEVDGGEGLADGRVVNVLDGRAHAERQDDEDESAENTGRTDGANNGSRDGDRRVGSLLRDRDGTVKRTNSPDGGHHRHEEGESLRVVVKVLPAGEGELGSVELATTSNGETNDGHEGKGDVQDNRRGLETRKDGGAVGTEQATEEEDAAVKAKSGTDARSKVLVDERARGEEDTRASPRKGRDGGDVTEERVVWAKCQQQHSYIRDDPPSILGVAVGKCGAGKGFASAIPRHAATYIRPSMRGSCGTVWCENRVTPRP